MNSMTASLTPPALSVADAPSSDVGAAVRPELHPADALLAAFNHLTSARLDELDTVYAENVVFIDPAHELRGLPAVKRYFAGLYAELLECRFAPEGGVRGAEESVLLWTMHLRHRRVAGGAAIAVPGASHLRHGRRVHYHRDYFDLGALLYERLPLLGPVVRGLKRRLGG